jgi:lipoprotein NlpD
MRMQSIFKWMVIASIAMMAACASQRPAPVVDRSGVDRTRGTVATPVPAPREAKEGIYIARSGDTLYAVAASFGVDPRDIARWNDMPESSTLRPGQALRVVPPAEVATVNPITRSSQVEVRPLPPPGAETPVAPTPLPPTSPAPMTTPPVPPIASAPPTAPPPSEPARASSGVLPWQWPAAGRVIETFDDPRNKGIDIAGVEGAPVMAAADGEVVYVGSAVRGYGNLVIVRHNDDYITAYAHNRKVLVAEKQTVKRGQTIAELGRSDADRPKLHFELRHQGKPVDPLRYLPARSQ